MLAVLCCITLASERLTLAVFAANKTLNGNLTGLLTSAIYEVTAPLTVPLDQTLRIEPGTVLLFRKGTGLTVQGTLLAAGSPEQGIRFISAEPIPAGEAWDGITFVNADQKRSFLEYTEIASSGVRVKLTRGTSAWLPRFEVTIKNSNIHHGRNGIYVDNDSGNSGDGDLVISDNQIHDNAESGIALYAIATSRGSAWLAPVITGNRIFASQRAGISIETREVHPIVYKPTTGSSINGLVARNSIMSNALGISLSSLKAGIYGYYTFIGTRFENNLIINNRTDGISLSQASKYASMGPSFYNNTVAFNKGAGLRHGLPELSSLAFQFVNNIVAGNLNGVYSEFPFSSNNAALITYNDIVGSEGRNWVNYPPVFGALYTTNLNGLPADSFFNISVEPQFVSGSDFHLSRTSPLLGAGTLARAPTDDFDGQMRGSRVDMGFDDFEEEPPLPPSSSTNLVLLIVSSDGGSGADLQAKAYLEAMELSVAAIGVSDPGLTNDEIAVGAETWQRWKYRNVPAALVVISSTVLSAEVRDKFRGCTVPVLLWEYALQDDMLLTSADPSSWGKTDSDARMQKTQTQINLIKSDHPLAAGFSTGVRTVSLPTDYSWGVPGPAATVIATMMDDPRHAAIYGYEKDAIMIDGVTKTPARRVFFLLSDWTFSTLNADGRRLFEAAVYYALSRQARFKAPLIQNGTLVLSWIGSGALQSSDSVIGPWTNVPNAGSPYTTPISERRRFYRIKQ